MIKHYFTQAISQLRQHPVISGVTIFGTAMAIFLIMLVVMIQQVKVAPFSPESNRDRFLHFKYIGITNNSWREGSNSNGCMSYRTAKECFKPLEIPEAVTTYSYVRPVPLSLPTNPSVSADMRETDDAFWQVFDFDFIDGKPYTQAELDAFIPVVILSETVARRIFGTTDVVGRELKLSHTPYTVCGVVRDVSTLADCAYAQAWIPLTRATIEENTWNDGYMGDLSTTILARSRSDFEPLREELYRRFEAYNQLLAAAGGYKLIHRNRPYDQEKESVVIYSNREPDLPAERRQQFIIFLILLLVPAINLSSMTQSRLRQRVAEIGVRRAFGSTRFAIVSQIVLENLIITLLAGFAGWMLSLFFATVANEALFPQSSYTPSQVHLSMLLHGSTFFMALLFCFLLNLLSSGIPAWRASRTPIVNALSGKTA